MSTIQTTGPDGTAPPGSSGISVIVVGLGICGLSVAIECHRKGHRVKAYEKTEELKPIGAGLAFISHLLSTNLSSFFQGTASPLPKMEPGWLRNGAME